MTQVTLARRALRGNQDLNLALKKRHSSVEQIQLARNPQEQLGDSSQLIIKEHDYTNIFATEDRIEENQKQMLNAGAMMDASFDHGEDSQRI